MGLARDESRGVAEQGPGELGDVFRRTDPARGCALDDPLLPDASNAA